MIQNKSLVTTKMPTCICSLSTTRLAASLASVDQVASWNVAGPRKCWWITTSIRLMQTLTRKSPSPTMWDWETGAGRKGNKDSESEQVNSLDRDIRQVFLGGPVVKTALPMQGVQVQSLGGELRSHKPRYTVKKQNKQTNKSKVHDSKVFHSRLFAYI